MESSFLPNETINELENEIHEHFFKWVEETRSFPEPKFNTSKCGASERLKKMSPTEMFELYFSGALELLYFEMKKGLKDIRGEWGKKPGKSRAYGLRSGKVAKKYEQGFTIEKEDLMTWLAIWLHSTQNKRVRWRDYWKQVDGDSWVKSLKFPRENFEQISRQFCHLSEEFCDTFQKMINLSIKQEYKPHRNVAIDEMMAKVKGRCKERVFNKQKPVKWGLKYFASVDSITFLWHILLFKREKDKKDKKGKEEKKKEKKENKPLGVVLLFAKTLPSDVGEYCIFGDNWYGSIELVLALLKMNFRCTFTVRSDRPSWFWNMLHENIQKNFASMINPILQISAISWEDKGTKPTNFLSSHFGNTWCQGKRRV